VTAKEITNNKKGKHKELYDRIMLYTSFLPEDTLFTTRFWYWENQKNGPILCSCGCQKVVKFPNKTQYARGCHNKREDVKEKKKQKSLEKYGVCNPSQAATIKEKKKQKSLEKYGTTSTVDQSLMIPIWQEKYGVTNPSQLLWVKEKISQSHKNLRRENELLGVRSGRKQKETQYETLQTNPIWEPLFSKEEYGGCRDKHYHFRCRKCGTERTNNLSMGTSFRCFTCEPRIDSGGQSKVEKELADFCRQFTVVEEQTRQIISPLELDIYMPEKKIAVELHGLYWHTEQYKNKNSHLRKLEACQEKGLRLIQIFEDEWRDHKKIVQSRLKHILVGSSRKLYARQCRVEPLSAALANKFLAKYHLQGPCNSPTRFGLFFKSRLVAVMTFSNRKALCGAETELVRYCTLANWSVVGGAGKLLRHFVKKYNPKSIISFADRRWSDGNLYRALGFTLTKTCRPGYAYVIDNERKNRIQFQKHKLQKKLPTFDSNLSESENMRRNGYYRIWDAGQLKFTQETNPHAAAP
jgi:hypothetical protein